MSVNFVVNDNSKMINGLVDAIKRQMYKLKSSNIDNDKRHQRIIASSVNQKYRYFIIPNDVLKEVAEIIGVAYITQKHYQDSDADYCGDASYTWLELGPNYDDQIKLLKKKMSEDQKEINRIEALILLR